MKSGAVVYKGKYGATKQYAQWLSDDLELPCLEADLVAGQTLNDFDYIILGSSVYYGKLLLRPFLVKHLEVLKHKKVFIFISCATPDSDQREQKRISKENIPEPLQKGENIFFLPGKLDLKALTLLDRTLLRIAAFFEKDPERKKIMTNGVDAVSKENLIDLDISVRAFALATH
ncbi:flavodoxin domain-containing protein [Dyadobacter bucti]|uniref:flavodoxin domain-containing protein n=1 Tax=Dyadobacter bucti TaxID=2572203 RepID=UPI003F7245D6